jgi:hypothetical protein
MAFRTTFTRRLLQFGTATAAAGIGYLSCNEHGYLAWTNARSVGGLKRQNLGFDWTVFRKSLKHGDKTWELLRNEDTAKECKLYFDKYPELLNDKSWWYLYSHRHPWTQFWRLCRSVIRDSRQYPHVFGGVTPIYWAIERKNNSMVKYFIDRHVNLDDFSPDLGADCCSKYNLVTCAIRQGNLQALELLLGAKAPIENHIPYPYYANDDFFQQLKKIGELAKRHDFVKLADNYLTK